MAGLPISPHWRTDSTHTRPADRLSALLNRAIADSAHHLFRLQQPDGHWVAELEGDTILESEWILLMAYLGREGEEQVKKAANYILAHQLDHGGWSNYPGGPLEVSISTKAYFALKLAGHDPAAPYMSKARQAILTHGGAAGCNSFTRFYLALLGQIPYSCCASVPPEMMLLPRWFYFNLYAMSSWTRTIVVPLSIFSAAKPVRQLPPEKGIRELFVGAPEDTPRGTWTRRPLTWNNFFLALDWVYKQAERVGLLWPFRKRSLRLAAEWMRERFQDSDGLGAIFPPMVYTVIALRCLGVPDDDPEMRWAMKQLDDLAIEEGDTLRLQPCVSPVWDTALAVNALADAGHGNHPLIERAVQWLLKREVRRRGDWSVTNPHLEPSGWCFEYNNAFYPDFDDTVMVLMALAKTGHANSPEGRPAAERALRWLLGMQNSDGGWAAFDRDINRRILTKVPFADHNAMLDPSCPDITARVLEGLSYYGCTTSHPQAKKAIRFILDNQEPNGAWFGRWGVNYLYGTWQVLQGLRAVGFSMQHPAVRKAVDWLKEVQHPEGGWGESCGTYDDPALAGRGTPTASQTAWALLGLIAAGEADPAVDSDAVRRGADFLLRTQRPDGGWDEPEFTGTGFPKVFYLRYHYYPFYFPLMALARLRNAACGSRSADAKSPYTLHDPYPFQEGNSRPASQPGNPQPARNPQ